MGRLTSLFFASLLTEDHTMFIGQTIVAENTTGTTVYTPWFPRQGDAFTSSVEVIAFSSTGNLVISILDKDPDQTGDAPNAAVGSFDTITGVGTPSKRVSGLRPLVRYKIVLQRASGTGTIYATLRMLAPSWESTGAQGV
jgi:phosphoribosylformylglycinamidine (FGAM) synthase-like amidotransferase family enzyme